MRLTSSLALALVAAVIVAAQTRSPQKPTFRSEANFVRVDAYPTVGGQPVQDLTIADFEVLENGKPQKIETFEHVVVQLPGPEAIRADPNTVADSRQLAREARGRLFIVFLDSYHVTVGSSHRIRQPLVSTLDRLITADDVVGVMTPEMTPDQIAFGRKTTSIEDLLTRNWNWGERFGVIANDPVDDSYRACYPGGLPVRCPDGNYDDDRGVADEMMDRRREKQTIDALRSLVRYSRTLREERKAIVTITEGWRLFTPDRSLTRRLYCMAPLPSGIGVDPRTGQTVTAPPGNGPTPACEADRIRLANLNDAADFRIMLDEANRSNVSFYPVDPRGLAVFDEQIAKPTTGLHRPGTLTVRPPDENIGQLRDAHGVLRDLANATDGIAILNSTNLTSDMRRIVSDLSSYYLLGYYSTAKLDGEFHQITVRVRRPGVQVRARRGYQALSQREVDAARAAAFVDPAAAAVSVALKQLPAARPGSPVRVRVGYGLAADPLRANAWAVLELDQDRGSTKAWEAGASARITVTADGRVVAAADAELAPSSRNLFIDLSSAANWRAGDYTVRVESTPHGGVGVSETVPLVIPDIAKQPFGEPLLFRRGPFSGAGWQPAADLRFRRQERIRVEVATTLQAGRAAIRLLGKTGAAVNVPIAVSEEAKSGVRTIIGEMALAPLAPADYVLEVSVTRDGQQQKTLVGFRLVT